MQILHEVGFGSIARFSSRARYVRLSSETRRESMRADRQPWANSGRNVAAFAVTLTAMSHIVANVITLCLCEAAERLLELPRCFQLRHIGRVIAQTFPRPDIFFLRRQALGHAVIILDDLRLLLHVEIAEQSR